MSNAPPRFAPPDRSLPLIGAGAAAVATLWLFSRIFYGLDLSDEMQYYGQIESLTRTGVFFQSDLFIQQLGYFFLLPFFKAHALLFPDQSYLVLYGRLVLLAGYGAVGILFWRRTGRAGQFSAGQRLVGLAAMLAWIPAQLFAPSYNTLAYLFVIALVTVWLVEDPARPRRSPATIAVLLTMLMVTHPPIGLALTLSVTVETFLRRGSADAIRQTLITLAAHALVVALMMALHGVKFWADLMSALKFSRGFDVGGALHYPPHLLTWLGLIVVCAGAVWWLRRAREANSQESDASLGGWHRLRWLLPIPAVAALAAIVWSWNTGSFAAAVFVGLLALGPPSSGWERKKMSVLGVVGALLGSACTFGSSNGVHSFGMGTAGVIPFLLLYSTRLEGDIFGTQRAHVRCATVALLPWLLLLNGTQNPYRDFREWLAFQPVSDVPAFRGIRASAVKLEALEFFSELTPPGGWRGKRLLVVGPHPAGYFFSGAEPAPGMFFMHLTGRPETYELVARHLARSSAPDIILITCPPPAPLAQYIDQWRAQGSVVRSVIVPPMLNARYVAVQGYHFSVNVIVLTRPGGRGGP